MYLTPDVIGKGLGRQLMTALLDEARKHNVETISLDSSITAHEFYKRFGFRDAGPMEKTEIGGSLVTSYPMQLTLR